MAMEEIQETELSKDAEQETEFSQRETCKAGNKQEETEEHSSPRGVLGIPITGSDSDHGSIDRSSSFGSEKSTAERGESLSSSSSSSLSSSPSSNSYGSLYWKKMLGQVKKRSVMSMSNISSLLVQDLSKKALRRKLGRNRSTEEAIDCGDLVVPKPSWRNFSYQELTQATYDFSPDKLIGKGGHAEVYKGFLPDGQVVAVKKIIKEQKNNDDRVGDFLSELGIIAHIDHPNAAKLFGFSADSGLHLILHFCPHGSLADMLHGSGETLKWKVRYKVAIGVAEGLHYLHCECPRRIIHRDITASNILLSDDYEAQISDFGLAKWLPEKWVHHVVSPIEGTFGYMAPEYFMHGIVDEKTDVFAFGVLLLELMTGRRAVDSCRQSLVMWAKPLLEKNNVEEIADPRLGDSYDVTEMKRAMYAASICIHHAPNMRPDMLRVVQLLKGEKEAMEMKQKLMGGGELLLDPLDLETYTSTTYLKDLNRHRQLVME